MTRGGEWLPDLLDWLLPDTCLGCGRLRRRIAAPLGLCRACHGRLARLPREVCAACARPLPGGGGPAALRCGRCRADPPPFDRLWTIWLYQPPFDGVIAGLKFLRLDYLGRELAAAAAARLAAERGRWDLVVPVPLHWRRRLQRGFNQAERIARPLAAELGLPFASPLRRRRATRPQALLRRGERLAGPRAAFALRQGPGPAGRRVLLVDDVVTTGATLRAAAAALRRGGATVEALALGATPEGFPSPGGAPLHPLAHWSKV